MIIASPYCRHSLCGAVFCLLLVGFTPVFAQSTYGRVTQIIATNCAASCHNTVDPTGSLYLDESFSSIKDALVNVVPTNQQAANRGDKLADPGHPERSFLLRKLNDGAWEQHPAYQRTAGDSLMMPAGSSALAHEEIELIRQWILYGCPDTGTVVDEQVLYNFYHVNGGSRVPVPAAPADSLGFQIKFGPFFLAPQTENEYLIKYHLKNANHLAVTKLEIDLQPRMHHFIIEKFLGNSHTFFPEGYRDAASDTSAASIDFIAGAQFSQDFNLPQGTAYMWYPNMVLDLNGHAANIYPDSTLALEAYVNVYHQQPDSTMTEMYSVQAHYSGILDSADFVIYPGEEKTFTDSVLSPNDETLNLNFWLITSHTHKFGTSYRVYERDACGGKGEIIYDGHYNQSYTANQGFFDFEHPTVRYFDDTLRKVPLRYGIIHEATFHNTSLDTVYFGLTTADEMMNIFIQFTVDTVLLDKTCAPDDTLSLPADFAAAYTERLYPNPANGMVYLSRTETDGLDIAIWNILGERVLHKPTCMGRNISIDISMLAPGSYLFASTSKQGRQVHRLIVQ